MKHYRPLLMTLAATATFISAVPAAAQQHNSYPEGKDAAALIREDSLRTGGNQHKYEYLDLTDTKAPKGYKPFYISHYGRHGSRSEYKGEEAWIRLERQLRPAHEAGILSYKGEQAYQKLIEMCEVGKGMKEMLTKVGVREHKDIAARMYERFTPVFKGSKEVEARASTVQRCIVSMAAFTTSLAAKDPDLDIDILTGKTYMDYIANTNGYQEATKASDKLLKDYSASITRDTVEVFNLMFNDPAAGRALITNAYKFESDIITTANYSQCLDVEDVFHRCLPFQVYYDSWSEKNRFLYIKHCNSVECGDKRLPIAQALVDDVISKADAAVAGNGRAADLRFGHDYPLMALAAYFDLEGFGSRYSFDEIDDNWFGSWNICMGSNLQIIFYRNKQNDVLVKCLYNEKETPILGLTPVSGPYYRWSEVRAYWTSRF